MVSLQAADQPPAADADVSGVWVRTFTGRDGQTREIKLILEQSGSQLTGEASGFRGEPVPLRNGKVEGGQISFDIVRATPNGEFTMTYTGQLEGDVIRGTMSGRFGDRTFERPWEVKRQPADPAGQWQWTMQRQDGQTWRARLILEKKDGRWTGRMMPESGDWQVALREVQLKGSRVSWKTVFERNGNPFVINSSGVVLGDRLKGRSTGERNGRTWSREWQATRVKTETETSTQ